MYKKLFTSIVVSLFVLSAKAQYDRPLQNLFLEAEYFLFEEHYADALPVYMDLYEKFPDNANIAYRIGCCYLNIEGQKHMAIEYLETASKNVNARHKEGTISQKSAPYNTFFELGKAYSVNYMFDKAKDAFLKYKETLLPNNFDDSVFIEQVISACDNAVTMIQNPVSYKEKNIGHQFNDEKANFNPLLSSDGQTFAYMVSLKFYNAVMVSRKIKGRWSKPENLTSELQLDGNIFISGLSSGGDTLLLSKYDNLNSNIYMSVFNGESWSHATKLNKNINTKYWESNAFITEDGNHLIFASDRPGGFGGLDLYLSTKVNGTWTPAINLGPQINSALNEDRPILINGNKTLFFCSQGHKGMGGYDIFKSELQPNNLWGEPHNLGYPINTPDDNIFFMPLENGKAGLYPLYKITEGYGNYDIYKITF